MTESFTFKIAEHDWEFEQIHKLNYATFVEEIPQHEANEEEMLVDRFHKENKYVICLNGDNLVGMIAIRSKRPFSLDEKLDDLDAYLPSARSICEIRLLAVKKSHRHQRVFYRLLAKAVQYCEEQGYDLAIISGALSQRRLYDHMGFLPFGSVVGGSEAYFQPMYLTFAAYEKSLKKVVEPEFRVPAPSIANLLPGPVDIKSNVYKALSETSISHRSLEFHAKFKELKRLLCQLVNAQSMEILMGSGTLANDVVAGQLSIIPGKGLILSNGEFGERLIDHGKRFGLSFETLSMEWGEVFDLNAVRSAIEKNVDIKWVWMAHCETSAGVLNDLEGVKEICNEQSLYLCADCISSIANTPVNLEGVYLASGASGKGLASFCGLSLVFYHHEPATSPGRVPRYMDLGFYREHAGVPFTISSNLVNALYTSVKNLDTETRMHHVSSMSAWLRAELRKLGWTIMEAGEFTAPFVINISIPDRISSLDLCDRLRDQGFLLSYESYYLVERNWIQICLMGDVSKEKIEPFLEALGRPEAY
ncbi:MAG: aminotransferase class V-fold PLP-dependent enzyme [Deltaproteobacteria bacterium]|nr:aminotransferase class V-fold PLP-dependent enzyme [Deltaproteobacteria bacterium]